MHHKNDMGYKWLFSHPKMVQNVMESFVPEEFVKDLDFTTLDKVDKSFVTKKFRKKESDMIWKVKFKERYMYIYILFEFQSTVDTFMSLRMLRYICELWEDLIKNDRIKMLPPVFPLLIYNGEAQWTAPKNISDLIDHNIPNAYIPYFSYFPLIENEIPEETLLSIKNAVSAIFLCENTRDFGEIERKIEKLVELLKTEQQDIVRLFTEWFYNIFVGAEGKMPEQIEDLKEVGAMLRTVVEKHKEELLNKGRQEGRQEGRREGLEKGLQKGLQKGTHDTRIETARTMLSLNYSINDIIAVTKLSREDIEAIKNT